MLIFHRRENTHLIQSGSDAPDGDAVLIHGKYHLHILADRFINNELVLILRGLLVAVGSKSTYKLAAFLLDLQAGTDFHGDVLAVGIVNQVLERNDEGVRLRIAGQTVVSIVDGNKPDAELRKDLLKIAPAVDVVS